jgi:uncharacterized delta-60 repeat protein
MSASDFSRGADRLVRVLRCVPLLAVWLAFAGAASAQSVFSWTANTASVNENGGSVVLTAQRTGNTAAAASVLINTSDTTANAGVDYTGINNLQLDFVAGQTTSNVTVTILQDSDLEGLHTFGVSVSSVAPEDSTTLPNVITVTIVDDDALIRFSSATTNIFENAAGGGGNLAANLVQMNFDRLFGTVGAVSVQVEIFGGTAYISNNVGSNVTLVSASSTVGTVTFADGQTNATLTITLVNNLETNSTIPGYGTTVQFRFLAASESPALSTTGPGATTTGSGQIPTSTLTVSDDEVSNGVLRVRPEITAATQQRVVQEGNVTVTFEVQRSGGALGNISVIYETFGAGQYTTFSQVSQLRIGSDIAVPGLDYTTTSGTLTWGAGDSNPKTFTVAILDDTADPQPEHNKDVFVRIRNGLSTDTPPLANPTVATTATLDQGVAAITILDADQPGGALDRSWNLDGVFSTVPANVSLPGPNSLVYDVKVDAAGRAVVVGDFTSYNTVAANRVVRVATDGQIDSTFGTGQGADNFVAAVAVYTSGGNVNKAVLVGAFTSFDGVSRNRIARLTTTGARDDTFNPGAGFNGTVRAVALQTDGKVVVGGTFTAFNGVNVTNLARLNTDGSLDNTFDISTGVNDTVYAVAVDSSGRIYLGGDFTTFGGVGRNRIARVTSAGILDTTFDPGTGCDGTVYTIAVQSDQAVVIGGAFTSFNQLSRTRITRLTTTGALDTTFNPGTGFNNLVQAIALQPNNQAVVVGSFTSFDGTARTNVLRLLTDGSLDTSFMDPVFNTFAGPTNSVTGAGGSFLSCVAVQADGNILVGGSFDRIGAPYYASPYRTVANGDNRDLPETLPNALSIAQLNTTPSIGGSKVRWHQVRPRQNLARLIGRGTTAPGNVEFEFASNTIGEAGGTSTVRLRRSNGSSVPISVPYQTIAGSATPGVDYTTTINIVNWFQSGSVPLISAESGIVNFVNNSYIAVPISSDSSVEGDEILGIALSTPSGSFSLGTAGLSGVSSITPVIAAPALGFLRSTTLTITDDDFNKGVLGFSAASYSALENAGNAIITVLRTNGTVGVVTVNYASSAGTATPSGAGQDYTNVSGTLSYLSGETSKTFAVPIVNDATVENDETITLTLTFPTGGAALDSAVLPVISTLTIIDDDLAAGRLSFSQAGYTVAENAGTVQVTIQRTGGAVGSAAANFYTQDGTATNGAASPAHYITNFTALSWGNGDASSRTLTLTNHDNFNVEGTLSFNLILTNISGAAAGTFTNATVTITEDDAFGTVQFSQPSYSVVEDGGIATITVVRTGGRGGTVTADFSTGPGTAIPYPGGSVSATGSDYTNNSGTITLNPGITAGSFNVGIINNPLQNANKTVNLVLNNVLGGASLAYGTLDPSFLSTARLGANGTIRAVAAYTSGTHNGKYLIAGDFTSVHGVARNGLARLNPDGSVDNSFSPGTGPAGGVINAVSIDASGNVAVAGSFTSFNGAANTSRLVMLEEASGAVNTTFSGNYATATANGTINAIGFNSTNGLVLAGGFTAFGATTFNGVALLSTNGSTVAAFGTALNNGVTGGSVNALVIDPSDNILIGGSFTQVDSLPRTNVAVLTIAGVTENTTFTALGAGVAGGVVNAVAREAGGTYIIAGTFTTVGGVARSRVARLNADGSVNTTTFTAFGNGVTGGNVNAVQVEGGGTIMIAGTFTTVGVTARSAVARLNADGSANTTTFTGFGTGASGGGVNALALDLAGRSLIGGDFLSINGTTLNRVARLTTAGVVDSTFAVGAEVNGAINAVARQSDGKLVIAGAFTQVSGISRGGVARLNVDGTLDATFDPGTGVGGGTVNAVAIDGSGRIFIGGSFTTFNGASAPGLAGLLANGTLDAAGFETSFGSGATGGAVNAVKVDGSGRIVIGGAFTSVNGDNTLVRVAYLKADGSIETAFNSFGGVSGGVVNSLAIDASGNILIGGGFTTIGAATHNGFARLLPSGAVDPTFTGIAAGGGVNGGVAAIAVETGGKILIGGAFTTVNGTGINRIARLNTDGTLDGTFVPSGGANNTVNSIVVDSSAGATTNTILLAGMFTTFNGQPRTGFARLTPAGALDSSASAVTLGGGVIANGLVLQPDARVVIVGNFVTVNGTTRGNIARIGGSTAVLTIIDDESQNIPAGSIDTLFSPGTGANASIQAMALQTNGSILIGGDFTQFNAVTRNRIARLAAGGTLDTTFLTSGVGFNGTVRAITLQPNGRVLVGGSFTTVNATNRNYIVRLATDGTLDNSFNPGSGADNPVFAVAVHTNGTQNGKVVIGGTFATFNGTSRNGVARLGSDGALDPTFTVGTGANGTVYALAIQSDGRLLVGGEFTAFNGTSKAGIIRLNTDGTVDPLFNPAGVGANGSVRVITLQSDGSILIGGLFTSYNGAANNYIAKLDRNGVPDGAFTTAVQGGADNAVYAIALQDDGKIVLAGDFSRFHVNNGNGGVSRSRVTRLNPDGSVDPTINFGTGANGFIGAALVQRNASNVDQIVLGGGFTTFNGTTANYLARLNGGSLAGAGRLEFTAATYSVVESGGSVPVSIIRRGGTSGTATNTLLAVGGTAVNGTHYTLTPTNLGFPAGEVIKTVNITVTNDTTVNVDRTVNLVLSNFVNAVAGNQTNAVLTIQNDDAIIDFSSANYSVNENVVGGFVTVTVNRSGATVGIATVNYNTTAGTAGAGLDYTNVSGALTFSAGDTAKTFNIPIVNDGLVEGNETVLLSLSGISGAIAGLTNATLTIVEDDFAPGEVSFSAATYSVNEAGGAATISVVRSNGFTGVISVNFATVAGGTAISSVDYTSTNGNLAFADGQSARSFTVPILVNSSSTNNSTVNLQLSGPVGGATLGGLSTAVLTIQNNDVVFGNFNFTNSVYTVSEGAGVFPVRVTRDGGSLSAVSVAALVFDGTATNGTHFTAATSNFLSWADGDATFKTFNVTIIDDGVVAGDRSFSMLLTNALIASVGTNIVATVNITDAQQAAGNFLFSSTAYSVAENATNLQVTILRANGFTATNSRAITASSVTAGAVTLTTATPHGLSPGSVITVTMSPADPNFDVTNAVCTAGTTATTVFYTLGGATAAGGTGTVVEQVQITALTTSATAVHPDDYTGVTNTFLFADGQLSTNFLISISNNVIVAGNKVFTLTLTNVTGGGFITNTNATVTIVDDDPAAGSGDSGFNPGTGPGAQVRTLGTNASGQLIIGGDFVTFNGQGQTNVARLQASGALDNTFAVPPMVNGAAAASVRSLSVQSDGRVVIGGQFTTIGGTSRVNLARLTSGGALDTTFAPPGGANNVVNAVLFQSNSRILVGGAFTTIAGGARNFVAQLLADGTLDPSFDPGSGANATVRAVAVDGSGVLVGGDFTSFNGTTTSYLVRLTSAGTVDGTFTVGTSLNGPVSAIRVQSDQKILIGGSFTAYGGNTRNYLARLNSDGSLDNTFNPGANLNNFVSTIGVQSDGKVVIGGGFTAFGSVSRNRFMRLTDSGALDPSINVGTGLDSFVDALLIQADGRIALGGSFSQFNGVAAPFLTRVNGGINLGEGIVGFSTATSSVYEDGGSLLLTVLRTAGTSNNISVNYSTANGTALAGAHYSTVGGTLNYATGETRKTFTVPILEDTFGTNVNRTFEVRLSNLVSVNGTASLGVSTNVVTIVDNDVIPNFSSATYIVSEAGGSVGIAVNRLGGPANAYSVQYATTNGSALAGTHYVANTGTLNWADGDTAAKLFFIGVINNLATNGNLTLGLSLFNATNTTLGTNTPLSGQITATLTIVDDEFGPGQIGFLSSAYSVSENSNSVAITVIRTNGSAGPMSVDFATIAGGTAVPVTHHTTTNGTFTWADGDSSSRTYTVFVFDDGITNADRTVNLRLSNFTGGSAIGLTNAVLTITDNDSLVGFSTNAFTVAENATNAVITILRTGATNTTVSVQFATANGAGATTPEDYTGTNVTITFDPGMTATNLLVAITNDTLVETDGSTNETVLLAIAGPVTGAVVLDGALLATNATLTILDDEIEFNFSAAGYSVFETNGTAVLDVIRTGVTNSAVLVFVGTIGGSNAVDGLDYLSTNATLSFAAGVITQSLVIPVLDNTVSNVSKALFVQLGLLSPGTQLGATNLVVLTIQNEDPPAVAGAIDPSFAASLDGTVYALGINTNATTPSLIGKLVVAGDFTTVGGTSRVRLARLNRDGTVDPSFNPGTGANSSVRALAVQPDGGVVIGGFFSSVGGTPRNFIARVNANGALDATFNPGSGPNGQVNALVRQADGKIVIGGQFTSVNGTNRGFLARLNADGSLDTTFDPGTGASATVRALALLSDGSVIAGGDFQFMNGVSSRGLARLDTSGAVDGVFAANLTNGVNGSVLSIAVHQGTHLVIGGSFSDVVNGTARTNLARFTVNGQLDNTFAAGADGAVNTVTAQTDGKLLLGGGFNTVNGVARSHVARLAAGGALDPAVNFGTGADNDVTATLEQFHDGQLVLGGAFTTFAGVPASRLVRLSGGDNGGNGVLEFSATNYTVSESVQATITVIRSGGLANTVTVDALTTNGTATLAGSDYLTNFVTLTFASGVNQATFTVTNVNDSAVEGDETVGLILANVVNATLGSRSNATLTIADDDARLAFNVSVYNVSESGTNALITVVRTGGTNGTVSVDFATTAAGSATAGTDYTATNGTLTFADGVTSGSFNVRVLGDATVEPDETIVLALSNPNALGQATAVLGALSTATLNILNDDFAAGTLSLATNAFSVSESGTNIVFTVSRANGTLGSVSVSYATANGTATAGPDYVAASGNLSWPDGDSTTRSFTVTINDDGAVEGNETFNLSLSGVSGGAGLGVSNAVVAIFDDDGVVQFSAANYAVSENVTNATVNVVRTGGTNNVVTFTYATTASGTASPGVDFTSTNGLLTFNLGVTNLTFNVPIINDQLAEANETIGLTLAYQTGVAFLGSLSNATITIVDNDIAVQFASAAFSVQENSPNATITVVRNGATNSSVSVNFGTSDGTAVNGQDYNSQIGTLTFAAGETSKTFSITILDDAVVESDETVNLSLSLPTGGATLGTPSTATLTIVNEDTGVEFSSAVYSVAENLTNALISVRRIGVTNTAFTVSFATSDNTAVAGVNYTNTNGVLSFLAGVVSNSFQVRLIDNLVPQGDKLVNLLLSNPTGGAVLGPQSAATLNIADNEVTLQFSAATYSVLEDQTNALITVTRLGSGGAVTVNYAATAGSASTNDFSLVSGTLSFGTGVTNLVFAVALVNDILSETNETVNLTLSAPGGGATLGAPSTATLRIVDNDRVGSLDSQFLTATGAASDVQAVAFYSNPASTNYGKVIIAGDFQTVDGTNRVRLARLLPDGTLDPSFNPGLGADNVVYCAAIQANDQIVIGGGFTSVGGLARNHLTRLNEDGSVDTNYNNGGAGAGGPVLALALQPDGKVVIGGAFTTYNGTGRARLARVNTDGTLDTAFAPAGAGASDLVYAVALDTTNNVVVGGLFTSFAGSARTQLARVDTNGLLDAAFTPALNAGAQVYALAVQPDGKVLAAGSFTISAFSRTNIVRLAAADGAVDPTFSAAAFANSTVRALALESAGNVLVGGDFTALNGASRGGFGRLSAGGTLDTLYDPGTGANGSVFAIATQPDGKAIIGGRFTTEDGVSRGNVARINGDHGVLFALGSLSVLERGTNVTLNVARLAGASGTITVDYATTNGSATAGSDYVATNGTLTFPPGVTNQNIVVTVLNDTVVEGDETFTVFLTNIVGGLFGSPTNCLVTIQDDDSTLQFTVAATNIFEDATSLILTVDRVGSSNTTVTLPFNTLDGAALHDLDYTGVTNTLTFDTNVVSQNVIIPILNDQREETNKVFTVVLGVPGGEASLGTNTNVLVTIVDNDSTLVLATNALTVFENNGTVQLTVNRTGFTNNTVAALFTTTNGTAFLNRPSFGGPVAQWKFDEAPGATTAADSAGTFAGTLSPTGAVFVAGGISGNALSLSRASNGFVSMGSVLHQLNTSFSLVAWVKLTPGDTSEMAVINKHVPGTTNGYYLGLNTSGGVFGLTNQAHFFTGGSPATTPVSTNAVNDGNWHQIVAVYGLGGATAIYVDGAPAEATAPSTAILTNAASFLIGGGSPGGVASNLFEGLVDEVQVYNRALGDAEIGFLHANPSQPALQIIPAAPATDFSATGGTLSFVPGVVSLTITVPLVNDQLEEPTEAFTVLLTNVTGEASFGPVTNASVTVLDNDSTLFLTTNAATVVESVGSVSFTVARTGFTNNAVTVPFSTVAGLAVAGSDYTLTTNVLLFDTNVISTNIVIPIVNDTAVEGTETFSLQLYPAGGEASLAGSNTVATITVTDDDSTLEFSASTASVTESAGSITLTVLRAGTSNSVVAVNFATTNGTALAGQDYVGASGSLTFGTNVVSRTISVTVLNDTVVEADDTFSVQLSGVTGEAGLGGNSNVVVTILNDDSTLQFTTTGYSVIERVGSVTLTVSRTGASNSLVSVPYASANVTAFAGADYTTASGTLTFGTNVTSSNIVVTILNDKLAEVNETFNIVLGTPGGEASLGSPSTASVTILDDESTIEFASTNVTSVLESGGSISLVVSRVGVIDTAVTVPFTFGDATAAHGVDYLGTNGTLAFGTNVAAQVVTVGILNDLVLESNKSFTITLGTPVGEALLGAGRVVTVTIVNDDSVLQFPFGQLNVAESAGTLSITVQRVGATNVAVAVDLATGDGTPRTATANVDYGTVVTNLIFAAGVDARTITLALTNDFIEEGTESFTVQLSNPVGEAALGNPTNLTINVLDDDFRTLLAAGVTLTAEGFAPTNNAVDPLETVTMLLALRNVGNVNATNITATLLHGGGVLNPGGPQLYTNLAAGGASLAMPFTFTATQAQTITATLQLSDVNGSLGTASFTIDLGVGNSYSNRSRINLPGTLSLPSFGSADPYPSSITVSNVAGVVNKVSVRLNGFTHSYPADVDVLLVSPTGQKMVLMSDAGSSFGVTNLTLTFEDVATANLPELAPLTSASFKPTDYAPADSFAAPAPAGPYATNLAVFNGFSPNGTWSLYIVDDTDQNFGNIVNGWTLNFNTVNAAIDLAATMTSAPSAVTAPATVTFTTVITNRGPNIATGVIYSNLLPAGLTFVSATTSAGSVTSAGSNFVVSLGTLGVGSNHVVTVTASTSGSGLVTNTASVVSAGEIELAVADNTASATVTIAPAIPFSLLGVLQTNGQFFITVSNAVAGRTYVVEAATNIVNPVTNTVWTPVGTNVAAGSTLNVTDPGAGGFGRRFYRAIER